jgi:hypothetical protein
MAEETKPLKSHGHLSFQGLPIVIEKRVGSVRKGVAPDGTPWRNVVKNPYGYVVGSRGADGEGVDVYVGPHKKAPEAHVVHQRRPDGKGYDEDKIMLGFRDRAAAIKAYLAHYDSKKFLGPVKTVSMERLKALLTSGKKLVKISEIDPWQSFVSELKRIVAV